MRAHAEAPRIAERKLIERPERIEALTAQLRNLVAVCRRRQHRQARTAADVACDRYVDARAVQRIEIDEAAAEKQVRGRTEHDLRPGRRQDLAFPRGQVDAVAEEGAGPEQAEVVVDVGVVDAIRVQGPNPFDLTEILGEMGLHEYVRMALAQSAGGLQLLGRRSGREAGRDCVGQSVQAVPAFDQCRAVLVATLRRVAKLGRRVAIHEDLARDEAHAARPCGLEERIDGTGMHGRVADGGRGAVREQLIDEVACLLLGERRLCVVTLLREGVALEPADELLSPGADHVDLREVHVRVHEAGYDQATAVIDGSIHVPVRGARCVDVQNAGDAPILDG